MNSPNFRRGIAEAIADLEIERVTGSKSARIGYTVLLTSALAHFVVGDPSPILVLTPSGADCRDHMVSNIEPLFLDSPALRDHLRMPHPDRSDQKCARTRTIHPKKYHIAFACLMLENACQ